jgi:glycosyltransferase involved in cell wall biosynthesis
MAHRILSIATEWFSYHGGLSTFNRSFCAALASAGHDVCCLVPRADQAEIDDAKKVGVKLVFPEPIPGLSDEAVLCLAIELESDPDIVIGHGHITGAVAAVRVKNFHPNARRIHVLHTLPDEIEPFKDRMDEDPAQRAHRRQETETALSISADLAVAVGPRLHRQWSTYIGGAKSGVGVHRLTPGLPDLKPSGGMPQAYWCLLMGRLEDAVLKGVDMASAALGIINKDNHFRGSREVTLVLRGTETGKSKDVRAYVQKHAKAEIPCTIREYTHREDDIRQDIARSSLLLMPSQMEGFGLVGIEALALGIPILISQRSGLGELLLELIDADQSLEFARRYIVDVGDGADADSQRWADAIREVLTDRDRAFKETAILREAILKADYWQRAVTDLLGVLNIEPRDPEAPPDVPPDLAQRAHRILDIDPATAIVYSSSLLERELECVVTSLGIAVPALPASKYVALVRAKGLLDPKEADLARSVLHLRNMAAHKFDATFSKDMAEEHMRSVETLVEKLKSQYPEAPSEPDENSLSKRASDAYRRGMEAETLARQSPEHVEKAREAAELFADAARLTEELQTDEDYSEEAKRVARPLAHYHWAMSYKNQSWYEYEKRQCEAALESLTKEAMCFDEAIRLADELIPKLSNEGKQVLQPQLDSWRVYRELIPSVEFAIRARAALEEDRNVEALDWYRHSIEEGHRVLKMADQISPRINPSAIRIIRANARTTIANSFKALARNLEQQSRDGKFDLYDFGRVEGLQFFGYLLEAYESAVAGTTENPEGERSTISLPSDRANLEEFLRKSVPHWGVSYAKFADNKTVGVLMEHINSTAYKMVKESRSSQ